jgi:hypothetical protein
MAGVLLFVAVLGVLDLILWFAKLWLPVQSRSALTIQERVEEAAGLEGGETLDGRLELDTEKRTVRPREHVAAIVEAKKPETHARRIERAVQMVRGQR